MALTQVDVYNGASSTSFPLGGSTAESDSIQITNIDGLDAAKANINTIPLVHDGEAIVGKNVPSRNIVITFRTNPDWDTTTHEQLRQTLYGYFTPKNDVRLVFTTDEIGDVEISGTVESVEANPFSQEPEFQVSIICPDPYFIAAASVSTGTILGLSGTPSDTITVGGHIPIGFKLKFNVSLTNFGEFIVQSGDPDVSTFHVISSADDLDNASYYEMDSRPLQKYMRAVETVGGDLQSVLKGLAVGSKWPALSVGDNTFGVLSDDLAGETWELTLYEKYGGI